MYEGMMIVVVGFIFCFYLNFFIYRNDTCLYYHLIELNSNYNQFYNILECIIIGWKLIPMPNKSEYKPHLVIYPLWENTFNKCMDSPLLLTPVKHKGIDLCVSYDEEKEDTEIKLLQTAFENLGEQCKKVIQLFYYEEKKLDEILTILNYTNKDVLKSQKSRCMKQLKDLKKK